MRCRILARVLEGSCWLASLATLASAAPDARADGAQAYVADELGVNLWHFAKLGGPERSARTVSSGDGADDAAAGRRLGSVDERVRVGRPCGLYLALDVELGVFAAQPETFSGTLFLISGGIRHELGPVAVAAELTSGALVYSADTAIRGDAVLDVRARIDVAITASATLGGVIGTSLLGDGWMAGVAVGFRNHPHR